MSLVLLILMSLFHLLAGLGLICLFKINLKPWMMVSLAIMLGIGVFSFVPFLMELCFIPLTGLNIWLGLFVATALCNVQYKQSLAVIKSTFKSLSFKLKIYEVPFVLLIGFMLFVSAWRCFYFPPTPRDLLSGAEAIAEYAVREKTMLNSVFTVNMESTNNQFKPPYLTSLQIIYKYAGFPFGQVWLIPLVAAFIMFLYQALSLKLHQIITGFFVVFFIAIREMYAYTFTALFDYSNAVFFFLSLYFLQLYFKEEQRKYLNLSAIIMAMATYTRSETLILAGLLLPLFLWQWISKKQKIILPIKDVFLLMLHSVAAYYLSISVFINHYLPVYYKIEGLLNKDLFNVQAYFLRVKNITMELVFSEDGRAYYNWFIYFFLFLLLLELVVYRKLGKTASYWLYCIAVVYFGLALASHIFPLMDITHSIKRGLFKMFPLVLLFAQSSKLLIGWSKRLKNWEQKLNIPN